VVQNSSLRAQLHSGSRKPADEADAKKLRKCLLRQVDSVSSVNTAEDDDDAVAEVSSVNVIDCCVCC